MTNNHFVKLGAVFKHSRVQLVFLENLKLRVFFKHMHWPEKGETIVFLPQPIGFMKTNTLIKYRRKGIIIILFF